jgi:large subunit ribosomal protein L17
MFRALTANLVLHERIETTDAKAKELRRVAERLISKARRLGAAAYTPWEQLNEADRSRRLAVKRNVAQFLQRFGVIETNEKSEKVDLVEKVFTDLAKRYQDRAGGYTRIIKLGQRRGDAAPMCLIELVGGPSEVAGAAAPIAVAEESAAAPAAG